MNTTEILRTILADLKALRGQPLTWENLQWFSLAIEGVREVATPSTLKDAVLHTLVGRYQDLKEIYIRRSVSEHEELVEKAGDLRLIGVYADEYHRATEPDYYRLVRL